MRETHTQIAKSVSEYNVCMCMCMRDEKRHTLRAEHTLCVSVCTHACLKTKARLRRGLGGYS